MGAVSLSVIESDYVRFFSQVHLCGIEEANIKLKKIKKAQDFCGELSKRKIPYSWCIRHPEVLGCYESKNYYQRYQEYLGSNYGICKHLLLHERKGQKRKFLVIVDDSKSVDLKELREKLGCSKLEFVSSDEMKILLDTTPGNVSLFHIQYDTKKEVELVLDQELLDKSLLAFHPLYNGMSIFLTPKNALKYLDTVDRCAAIMDVPSKKDEYVLEKTL